MGGCGGQHRRRRVTRRDAGRVAARFHKIRLQLLRVHPAQFRAVRILRRRRHDLRPLLVEVDQLLGNRMALDGVGAQQFGPGTPFDHGGEFPAEVEGVLHRHVHALAGLGAVRVAGVTGDEDARQARCGPACALPGSLLRRHIIEAVGDALANLVHREPDHAFHVEGKRVQHPLRGGDHTLLRVLVAEGVAIVGVDLAEIDVEPHQVAALARDQQYVALVGRLDRGFQADVGKVGNGQHVDHAPGVVGEVAVRHRTDGIAHQAACAVAAGHILGAHGALRAAGDIAQCHHDRMLAFGIDAQGDEFQAVAGLKPRWRVAHEVEQVLLQARLVDDHVREFREAVFGVLNPPGALDACAVLLRRTPEHGLVDPAGLAHQLLPQAECLEHLHRAAGDAIGLTHLERAVAALDQEGADGGEIR